MKFLSQILIALVLVIPWLFETITFQHYLANNPDFFTYSGARLPFFIVSLIVLGYFAGINISRNGKFMIYAAGCIAATLALIIALYQVCEPRQCYYVGPDGLGEVRFATMLSSCSLLGLVLGARRRSFTEKGSAGQVESNTIQHLHSVNPYLAATVVTIFVGIYPASLLYNVPSESMFRLALFTYYVSVPFVLGGFTFAQLFNGRPNNIRLIFQSMASQGILYLLFVPSEVLTHGGGMAMGSMLAQFAVTVALSIASGVAGAQIGNFYYNHGRRTLLKASTRRVTTIHSTAVFVCFAIFALHPIFLAPIDLMPNSEQLLTGEDGIEKILSPVSKPMYYIAAANNEHYFPTKRLEVELNFASVSRNASEQVPSFLLAGLGAQSPNCCKDGLDYGYRVDVLLSSEGQQFLLARAWETCDQNAACSGFPWRSLMHESIVPLANPSNSLDLAMEWGVDDRTVNWYFRMSDTAAWTNFSSFRTPEIENPFFNLGVISVNNVLLTSLYGSVNFFQTGVATLTNGPSSFDSSQITFECPAYYDFDGKKQCFSIMEQVRPGNTQWKVLWGWGLDRTNASIEILDDKIMVQLTQ
jgi:membrane protein DedA with SNARE-associated domain